ncbi:hypothetical protein BLA29_010329, partial [Euroglyphus maynei]
MEIEVPKIKLIPENVDLIKTSEQVSTLEESKQQQISPKELKPKPKNKDKSTSPVASPKSPEIKQLSNDSSLNEDQKSENIQSKESIPEETKKTKFSFNKSLPTNEESKQNVEKNVQPKSPKIQSPKEGLVVVKR